MQDGLPFWKTKRLDEMTGDEWESLCDGCGRCCLLKLEDEDTEEISIRGWPASCSISAMPLRRLRKPPRPSSRLRAAHPGDRSQLAWLPPTCAYRLIAEGDDLDWWHPLVSGDAETVHHAGISVREFAVSETKVKNGRYERFLLKWGARDRPLAAEGFAAGALGWIDAPSKHPRKSWRHACDRQRLAAHCTC